MEKWADYLISFVEYDKENSEIIKAIVHEDKGSDIGNPFEMGRTEILDRLEKNQRFITILKSEKENWVKGTEVRKLKIKGKEYLKTNPDKDKKDVLSNLPVIKSSLMDESKLSAEKFKAEKR